MLTAVFDIGKTNKKFFVFDSALSVVAKSNVQFEPVLDDDGEPCEDLAALCDWMRSTVRDCVRNLGRDGLSCINFSTYGASLVHVGEDGTPVGSLYNYLRSYPQRLLDDFHATHSDGDSFAAATGSPVWGMLNSGLQLYWIKRMKPQLYRKIHRSIHFPQYCSSLFSGHIHDEATSLGCHTGMWDYRSGDYHPWLEKEGLKRLVPPMCDSDATFPLEDPASAGSSTRVGAGVHDSSSALFPYLKAFDRPFLFISTGTWIVTMNPFGSGTLTTRDLEEGALLYLAPTRRPVRAARLFLGFEHDHHTKRIANTFGTTPEAVRAVRFDPGLLDRSRGHAHPFTPSTHVASGALETDRWDPSAFASAEVAYHALLDGIVNLEMEAIALARGSTEVEAVFVDGGFAKNSIFLTLLARALSPIVVATTELAQATAVGAALLVNSSVSQGHLRALLNTRTVST